MPGADLKSKDKGSFTNRKWAYDYHSINAYDGKTIHWNCDPIGRLHIESVEILQKQPKSVSVRITESHEWQWSELSV